MIKGGEKHFRTRLLSVRIIGILLLIGSIAFLNVSFLQQWTFISADHMITSLYLITIINFLQIVVLALGIVLLLYPKIISKAENMIYWAIKKYNNKRINPPPFFFVLLLLIFILSYIMLTFIGHSLAINEYKSIENQPSVSMDFFYTGLSFYTVFRNILFIDSIDYKRIDIPLYKLYIREEKIDMLNAHLPKSGEEYVDGNLAVEGFSLKENTSSLADNGFYDVKVRYRGDTFYHWYFPKKSWRVKLKNHQLINASNKFNIINPKLDSHIHELLAYKIAENAGLIVPRAFPVALFINNKYQGVYYYADQIDELFMRMQGKVPGDIFYGELYGDATRTGTLFENKSNWDIEATVDNNETRAYENIDLFIHAVNKSDEEFYEFFNQHLGDEYLQFYALTILLDEYRVDDFHNHKLYFNPTNGMFEPIAWDLMPFMNRSLPLNSEQSNALFSKINRIPPLVEKRNQFLKVYMNNMSEEVLYEYIDTVSYAISYEMEHDLFKDSYDAPWILTYNEWQQSIKTLKGAIHDRYAFIQRELDNVTLAINVINDNDNTFLVFDVAGQSGVNIETFQLVASSDSKNICYMIFKDSNFNMLSDSDERIQERCTENVFELTSGLLYPGQNDTIRYVYIIKTDTPHNVTLGAILASNSVTGNKVTPFLRILDSLDELPNLTSQPSLHPWAIPVVKNKTIILEGEVTLTEDLILNSGDTLMLLPNTTIRLGSGVSIISYGKIIAEGTVDLPISFISATSDPWGAVALQGEGANGSIFQYCVLDGGSGAAYKLVHYTGMLSAYNTKITIDHCILKNNKLMDDTFNGRYSVVRITNSTFENTFSDAIDMDISEGIIAQNTFMNTGGDAIDLMTSPLFIKDNLIIHSGDKGISVGEMSNPLIINNTIMSSTTGIAIKDTSDAILINNTLVNNSIGIAAYEKNWQYGGGGYGIINNSNICMNTQPISIQNSSQVQIVWEGKNILCTEELCDFHC